MLKFLFGVSVLFIILVGMICIYLCCFFVYDVVGLVFWVGFVLLLGVIFSDVVDYLLVLFSDYVVIGVLLIVGVFVVFIVWKFWQCQCLLLCSWWIL